ncbi:hypothetical protein JXB01_01275, partial [Candidatus Micrarchaeota archaeon]|nr:hypothetical protein [Candidatus Micrarchaeota archaeon]
SAELESLLNDLEKGEMQFQKDLNMAPPWLKLEDKYAQILLTEPLRKFTESGHNPAMLKNISRFFPLARCISLLKIMQDSSIEEMKSKSKEFETRLKDFMKENPALVKAETSIMKDLNEKSLGKLEDFIDEKSDLELSTNINDSLKELNKTISKYEKEKRITGLTVSLPIQVNLKSYSKSVESVMEEIQSYLKSPSEETLTKLLNTFKGLSISISILNNDLVNLKQNLETLRDNIETGAVIFKSDEEKMEMLEELDPDNMDSLISYIEEMTEELAEVSGYSSETGKEAVKSLFLQKTIDSYSL